MIGPARPQTDAGSVVEPQPAPFRLLLWELQPLPPPDALDPLGVHMPTFGPEQGSDPPIAISAILAGQADDRGRECLFIIPDHGVSCAGLSDVGLQQHRHVARRFPVRPGDDQHTAGDGRGLAISLKRLFQDQLIQRQIRDRLPETAILLLQVLQTLGLVSTKAAIFLAPAIVTPAPIRRACDKLDQRTGPAPRPPRLRATC